jgi:hypothetical protein
MTQHPIVAYLSLKGMSACEIHDNIIAALGPDAVSYSSVARCLRKAQFPHSKPEPHPADVQRDLDDSDQVILTAFEDRRFASVRQLSRLTRLPSTPSIAVLPNRWPLQMLEVQRDRAWHDIVTIDKSWFYLRKDDGFVWLPRDEKFPKENDTQFNRKNSCS